MGRIQSSVGLVTGIPITDTIQQLLAISARPRDLLAERTGRLRSEQVALADLTASVIGVQLSIGQLGSSELFERKQVRSSNESLLSASVTGQPAVGSHQFVPLRAAQSHQLLSSGFTRRDEPLGGGELALRWGGLVDRGVALDELNGGAGVQRGKIRITDRSGATAVVDLRFAQNIDDVIAAINNASDVSVTAAARGDRLTLADNSGQSLSNLRVQSVSGATTARDLGLDVIDVAASSADGQDVLRLYDNLALARLNDGNGVALRAGVADLQVTFRDGSAPLDIEFLAQTKGPTQSFGTTDAAQGLDAAVTITSVGTGAAFDGYRIHFVDDQNVSAGAETVRVDTVAKTVTFNIDAGKTRAADVVRALNNDADANSFFTAAVAAGGDGTGVVDPADTATTSGGAVAYNDEATLGDVLATLNAADPARLQARISADGDSLELIDLTSGSGSFAVTSLLGGSVAEDLGLTSPAAAGVLGGERRLAGLKTVLLDSLGGGRGRGPLGALQLTDRSGASATVDLSTAVTLDDVIAAINAAGVSLTARVNDVRHGIVITDTSGGSGNLVVANGDATNTADALRLAIDAAAAEVDSGGLDLQTFSRQVLLSDIGPGDGIQGGSFLITDTSGQSGAVNLSVSGAETVGQVLDLINALGIGVQARINETGDGILLVDTAGGPGEITVRDVGGQAAAAALRIAGTSTTQDLGGTPTKVIDGSTTLRITLDANDTLDDLVERINAQAGPATASVVSGAAGPHPFRLSLVSNAPGAAGQLQVDGSRLGVTFNETVAAQDALLLLGSPDAAVGGPLVASPTNTFADLVDGISLTLQGTAAEPVRVDVEQTADAILTQIGLFVDRFNALRDKIDDLTFFDEVENTTGVLFGSADVLRVEFDLANVITGRFFGLGPVRSLGQLGLRLDENGKLSFDQQKFQDQYQRDPAAVKRFFSQAESGLAARLTAVVEQLAGEDNSLLLNRSLALERSIELNNERIADLTAALERERESLFEQFTRLEAVVSGLQANLTAISQIQFVSPLFSSNRN